MVFVALLRAINLVRVNRVPMGELRVALADAGFTDITTHLQTGNVVLHSTKRSPAAVEGALEKLVLDEFGVDTTVIVRSAAAFARVAAANPFERKGVDPKTLHVAFLKAAPSAAAKRSLASRAFGDDELVLRGSEIYLRYPHGVAGSTMNGAVFEKALGTKGTVRTWKVVTRVAGLARP